MLYKQWLNEWLELYVNVSTKERTYIKYRQQARKYILPALGDYDVSELTAVELQKFSVSLAERGLSGNTVNGIVSILKSSLKKAVALGIADRQFADSIVRQRQRAGKVTCFCMPEQKKIEKYVLEHNAPNLFGIVLSLYTGLRIGELLALRWEDIDLKKGTAAVTKSCHDSWQNGHYIKVFDTTKTQSSERIIPLPKQIVDYMRRIKKQTKSQFVVIGRTAYGAQIRSYQRTFGNLLHKLHIPHKGFHALRHTFATRALEVGMDVKTLSEVLGHKNPMITLQRYAHSLMDHKTAMMNRVGRLLLSPVQ